jgi:DNA-binding response OmpR family regulator
MAKRRLLVIDDDVHVRKLLSLYGKAAGFDVREAASGDEALREMAEQPFDVVLLDLILPQLGGLRLCQKLKENDDRRPYIVVMTGDDSSEIRFSAKEAGADSFVSKPFDPGTLMAELLGSL